MRFLGCLNLPPSIPHLQRLDFEMSEQLSADEIVKLHISATLVDLTDNEQVSRLAVIGIGRVLFRHHKKEGDWGTLFDSYLTEIRHVIDWLTSAVMDGDDWIERLDEKGRPLKLMKMHSIAQLVAESDKAFAKKMQKIGVSVALTDDERLHMRLADGFAVVRMLTPEALDRETSAMQHCVGFGSYDRYLRDGARGLYSLRDPFNKPHATIEIDHKAKALMQLRGKQNHIPIPKYLKVLAPFIETEGLDSGETAAMGFVIGKGGIVHHISEIPDGAEFDKSLSFRGYGGDSDSVRIPSGIKVEGDLILDKGFEGLLSRPARVTGDVHANSMNLPNLSPDFEFGGGLHFEGSRVGDMPAGLHVRGDLVLKHCHMMALPEGAVIDGDLDLTNSTLVELPDDIVIKGSLHASNSALRRLPEGVSVGGAVFLGGTTQLEEIPAGFKVGGNIMLRDSSVRRICEDVIIGGMISINSDIAAELRLAETATVAGGLYFRPSGHTKNFEGRSSMSADDFRQEVTATPAQAVGRSYG
jgi:hypothetical protein